MILLDADPPADVRNSRKIDGIVVLGRWLGKATLKAMLNDLSKRNTAAKDKFDWKKTMAK
ncbi:hypothetical protein GCM10027341_22550 [Spirosoma knui]